MIKKKKGNLGVGSIDRIYYSKIIELWAYDLCICCNKSHVNNVFKRIMTTAIAYNSGGSDD